MKQIPVYLDEEIPKLQKRIAELEAKLAIAIEALEKVRPSTMDTLNYRWVSEALTKIKESE